MSIFNRFGRTEEIIGNAPGIQGGTKPNVDDDRVPEQKPEVPQQQLEPPTTGVDRIFDPRKLSSMQLRDINQDVIDRMNREDAQVARQQASFDREQRIRQDRAKAAMDKQLKEDKERQFFEAKQNLERQGIEYETDFEGRPLIKRDAGGQPVFKKKTGEIETDEKGRSFRYDRDAKGNLKKVYPDKDASIVRGADGFLYKENKYSPREKIDPEEGINSENNKIRFESAKELFRREEERLETALANPDLPKGPTEAKRKEIQEKISNLEETLKDPDFTEEEKAQDQATLEKLRSDLEEGTERRELERELFGLRKGGAASFLGKSRTTQTPKEDTVESLREESEDLKQRAESLQEKYQKKFDEARETFTPKSGVSADETLDIDAQKEAQRSFADIESDYKQEVEDTNARIALLNKRKAEYNSRKQAEREEAKKERELSIVKIEADPFLTENAQAIRNLDNDFEERFAKLEEIEDQEERTAATKALQEEYQKANEKNWASIEESNQRRSDALKEIGLIEAEVMRDIGKVSIPTGTFGAQPNDPLVQKKLRERDKIKNTLPDRIKKILTEQGFNEAQIQAAIQDHENLGDVNRSRKNAALLSNGSITVAPKILWNDKEAFDSIDNLEGATDEQKDTAKEVIRFRQESAAPGIIRQFRLTAFGDEWDKFEKEYQRKWSGKNNGAPAPDYETLKAFKTERADLWNNIEWEKFMLNNAQMLAWLLPGEKMKVAGNELRKQSEALSKMTELIDDQSAFLGFTKSELLGGSLSLLPSMAPGIGVGMATTRLGLSAVTASRVGLGATALSAGVQSAAPSYFDARNSLSNEIYSELIEENGGFDNVEIEKRAELRDIANQRADKQSLWISLGSGAITALITSAGGTRGVESLLRPKEGFVPIRQVVRQFSKTGLRNTIKSKRFYTNILKTARDFGINAGEEFVEEFSDQLLNGILEANTFSPNKSINEIFAEAWKAGTMGAVLGGGIGGARSVKDGATAGWEQWRNTVKKKESSLENIENPSDQFPVPITELDPKDQISRVDAEIDAWDAGEIDPASADLDRRLAKTAARLAVGDIDSINNSDLELIGLKRSKDGTLEQTKPTQGDTTWATVQNGVPIISQELLDSLRSRHEQLGEILPESEQSQRANIPTEEEAPKPEPTQEPTPEPTQEETAEPVPGEGQLFDVRVEGREQPVQVRAANQDEAISQVARQNIGLVQSATPVQEEPPAPAQDTESVNEIITQLETDQGKPLTERQKAGVRKAAEAVSGAIDKWGQIFSSVGWTLDKSGSGGLYVQDGKLIVSVPDLLKTFNVVDSPGSWANKAALEEAIHLAAVQLEQEGKLDVVGLYKSMPKEIQAATEKLYKTQVPEGQRDYVLAHEFLRFFLQGKINVKDGKWSAEGDIITEQSSPGFVAKLRETLQGILDFFAGIETQNTEFASELRKAEQLVRSKLSELSGLDLEQKSEPKPEKKVAKKNVAQKQTPTRGPPKKEAAEKPEFIEGRKAKVIQGNKKVKVQYIVQEADEGKPSHDAQGRKTKGYPQELQPRDRSTKEYRQQARKIAKNLDFEKAAFFPGTDTPATTADLGAPIMTQDGFTLIGNGREIAIKESYRSNYPASQQYKKDLVKNAKKFGLDPDQVSQMKNPVLKRVILDEMTDAELIKFSQDSNESEAMATSAVELSGQDASRITPELLMLFDPEFRLNTKKNENFRKAYIQEVIQGGGEKIANIQEADLIKRIRMGLFAAAYGLDAEGRAALDRMSGDMGENAKRLSRALETVSPMVARMRRDIDLGVLENMDISLDIAGAVQEIEVALREAKNVKLAWEQLAGQSQFAFDERGVKDLILEFMVKNQGNRAMLEEAIGNYIDLVYQLGDPRQAEIFAREELPTREELWQRATKPDALVKNTALATQNLEQTLSEEGKKIVTKELKRKAFWKKQSPELQRFEQEHYDRGILVEDWHKPILEGLLKLPREVQVGLLDIAEANSKIPKIPDALQEGLQSGLDQVDKVNKENEQKYMKDWNAHVAKYKPYKPVLDKKVNEIADFLGVSALHGPIKGVRGIAKAVHKAEDETRTRRKKDPNAKRVKVKMSSVQDVIRSSLVANSNAEVTKAVNEIYRRFKVIHNSEQKGDYESLRKEKLLHKDRFKSPKGEYRDHLFLIELEPGIIAEIQVHRADILHSKEIGPGHKVYEDTRILEESKLIKTNAQAKQHHSMLFGHMNKYYKSSQDYRTYEERPAAMRSASSLLMSIAPDSMNVNSVMRSMSDKGSSISTRLAKPGPISQGIFDSDRMYLFSSAINQDGSISEVESQRFRMFQEYKSGLPARAKASRVVFERTVNRDFKSLGNDRSELVNSFLKYQFGLPIKQGTNETPKEFRKRVVQSYPEPKKLPKNPKHYFDESLATAPVIAVPVSSLTTVRAREGGIANAEKLMAAAADGVISKRKPVDLRDNGDGTFTVLDGNSTTAIARKHDFKFLIGQIVETPALGTQLLDTDTDTEYLELAKNPKKNEKALQKMVDTAAKKAGYKIGPVYHGTASEFTVFGNRGKLTKARSALKAFFFTDDLATAKGYAQYAAEEGPIKDALDEAEKAEAKGDWSAYDKAIAKAESLDVPDVTFKRRQKARVVQTFLKGNFLDFDAEGKSPQELFGADGDIDSGLEAQIDIAIREGKEGVRFLNLDDAVGLYDRPSTHYAVFKPEQIKSSDPITRDDQGNVIPLSERFDATTPNILRSQPLDGSLDQGEIIMLKPEGDILADIKVLQQEAASVPGMQPLAEEDLHFTLIGTQFNDQASIKNKAKPNFDITLEPIQTATEVKPSGEVKSSVFARVTEQEKFQNYTDKVIGKKSPDTRRDYHITLATSTGMPRDAVAYPGKGSPRVQGMLLSQDLSTQEMLPSRRSKLLGIVSKGIKKYGETNVAKRINSHFFNSPADRPELLINKDNVDLFNEYRDNVSFMAVDLLDEAKRPSNNRIEEGMLFSQDLSSLDAEYLELAKNPKKNEKALQKMVDTAAKKAGYKIGPVYHGTTADFTSFDYQSIGEGAGGFAFGPGFYFTESKNEALGYTQREGKRGQILPVYLKVNKARAWNSDLLTKDELRPVIERAANLELQEALTYNSDSVIEDTFIANLGGSMESAAEMLSEAIPSTIASQLGRMKGSGIAPEHFLRALNEVTGIDAITNKDRGITVIITPEQIKLAEPVTKDDQGNVIPLSERFDSTTPNILRSQNLDTEYLNLAKDPKKNKEQLQEMVNTKAEQNGFTKKLYHGTWADFFEVFREGSYFSPVKEYADRYQSTTASSQSRGVSGRKVASKPRTMEFWVRMDNPFDTNDPKAQNIFYDEFYRKYGTGTPLNETSGLPDWTDGLDLFDFLNEHYPEYDGFIVDEGADPTGQPSEFVKRPNSFVPLNSYQIKSTDPVTKDKDGNIIPLSERFNESSDSMLRTQSFEDMVGEDAANEIDELYNKALDEVSGERTIGDPEKGLGAEDPEIMAVDEYRKENVEPETFEQWNAEARKMLEDDYEGTVNMLLNRGFEGGTLDPVQTRAAQLIVAEEMSKPLSPKRRDRVQKLVYSYRSTGTEQARGLAARRDPFKTPAERHKEFLGKILFTPPPKVRKELQEAESREEKEKILKKDQVRLLKIQKELEKMGVTFDDIFSGEVEITLKGAKIVTNITESYSDKQKRAFELLQKADAANNKVYKEIGKKVGLSAVEVEQVYISFEEEMRRKHFAKFNKGLKATSIETDKIPGLGTQDVSPEQAEAEFQKALRMMGLPPRGRSVKRKKTTKRKTARRNPPGYSSPEEQKRWEDFKDKELDPSQETEQEVMKLFDIDDIVDVVRVARLAQAADSNALDMLQEYWINNILSGPQTHMVNIVGNAANSAWDLTVQRGMEALINIAAKDEKGATFKEYKHIIKGILPGIARGMRLAKTAWATEVDFFRTSVLGEQVTLESGYIKGEKIRTAIPGKVGKVVRTPGRSLLFMDSLFKGITGTMEAGAQAYRIAKSEGLEGKELEGRIAELINTPNSQAWQLAVDRAEGYAFQTRIRSESEGGGKIESLVHSIAKLKNSNKLMNFVIPFVQTPYNIFRIGIRKSPLGSVSLLHRLATDGLFKMRDGKPLMGRYPELVRDLAEQVIAWTSLSLLYGATEGDEDDEDKFFLITGSSPLKRGEAGVRKRKAGGDYMIKIGGVMIPYGRIEPFSTMIGTTVDVIRSMKTKSTPSESMGRLYAWMLSQVENKTFIRGIGDLTRGARNPEQLGDYGKRFILQSIVPNMIRQPIRNADSYDREWQTKEWWYDILPLPSGAEKKIDPSTGKPIKKAGTPVSRIAVPKFTEPQKLSRSDRLLDNWNRNNPGETWGPSTPPRVLKVDDKNVELNRNSYSYLTKRTAILAKRELSGELSATSIKKPKEDDLQKVKNAYANARRQARDELRRKPLKTLGKVKE